MSFVIVAIDESKHATNYNQLDAFERNISPGGYLSERHPIDDIITGERFNKARSDLACCIHYIGGAEGEVPNVVLQEIKYKYLGLTCMFISKYNDQIKLKILKDEVITSKVYYAGSPGYETMCEDWEL